MDAEVKKILKKDVERGSPEYFQQHNKALSNIVQNLPAVEYARLQAMAKEWNEKGSPPDEQQRTAEKHGWKRVQWDDVHRWRDMGMVCLTFMAYHASNLRLSCPQELISLCSQDNIAQNMGAVATPFQIEYEALCTEMKKKLVNYVTMLERSLQPGNAKYVEQTEQDPRPDLQVILDEEGFPQLPEPPSFPQKHEELMQIVRKFLNGHSQ
ncbi:hypothetical protein LshimejAT787_0500130 [Lyophyllum shimeji]|uniref:Uncharacterized protein n=1 Tax=Lyophyllum shimeji TaxID=47721 RepID=A0A9P3PMG6_LYOSH|nr:hypothetical protein LshimejAT787_0500130 [Lyophyllum shimeji]